jgi:hypothetical protein
MIARQHLSPSNRPSLHHLALQVVIRYSIRVIDERVQRKFKVEKLDNLLCGDVQSGWSNMRQDLLSVDLVDVFDVIGREVVGVVSHISGFEGRDVFGDLGLSGFSLGVELLYQSIKLGAEQLLQLICLCGNPRL